MKVFKDCSPLEFAAIFGSRYDPKQPLFVNFFILREIYNFMEVRNREAMKYSIPGAIVTNFFWYYLKKAMLPGRTLFFASIPRTFIIYNLFSAVYYHLFVMKKLHESYKINIDNLLNRDEPYLYENEHFKGIVRRIHNLYPHLLNSNYEIDEDILKANKQIDDKFKIIDSKEYIGGLNARSRDDYYRGCLKCGCGFGVVAFDTIIDRYD